MSNEFYARKGLAIGTASLDVSVETPRVLVLGSDNVVKYRNNISSGSSVTAAAPTFSVQISNGTGLTGYGIIDHNRGNISLNRPGYLITSQLSFNTFVGASAGAGTVVYPNTANCNVFVGYKSGTSNTSGTLNSFLGTETGVNVCSGACNTLLGSSVGGQLTTQSKNTFIGTEAGKSALSTDSVLIGFQAGCGNNISASSNNVMVGNCAGFTNTTGANNTFVGIASGCKNTDGTRNVYIGAEAGCNSCGAQDNVFVGYQAGKVVTQTTACSTLNTFVGVYSGVKTNSGLRNTFIGSCTGFENAGTSDNVFIGTSAGLKATANCNIIIGACAGSACTITGISNIFVGYKAGLNNAAASKNIYIGEEAGCNSCGAQDNIFIGFQAGKLVTQPTAISTYNIFIGKTSGCKTTSGLRNTFIGSLTGFENSTQCDNVLVGFCTGVNTTASFNTMIGSCAGAGATSLVTGTSSVFVGYQAGFNNATGSRNIYIGAEAGCNSCGAQDNVFVGFQAGKVVTQTTAISTFNTFIGVCSGVKTTSGLRNTFIGSCTGFENAGTSDNVFIGTSAGLKATANCNTIIGACAGSACVMTGAGSVFVGYMSGLSNTGIGNTFMGTCGGYNTSTGCYNSYIGFCSGITNTDGCFNTIIGAFANTSAGWDSSIAIGACATITANNQLVLGSSTNFLGTASTGTFNQFLCARINGTDFKIPLYT